jgi:hypothetical protein
MAMRRGKGELRRNIPMGIALIGILLFSAAFSYAEMRVIGEGVSFRPGKLTPGGTLSMDIRFRVEGEGLSVPIAFSVVEAARTPDWSHPSIPTGTFAVNVLSPYTLRFEHTIPASIPPTGVCLNVYAHFTGTALRSALLISNACYGSGVRAGTGQTIILNHDLTVKINSFSVDRSRDLNPGEGVTYPANLSFTIRNIGTAPFPRLPNCWQFSLFLPTSTGPYPAGWSVTAANACDPIPGGGSVTVTKVMTIPDKASRIKVEVKATGSCRESDENNNKDERGITVLIPSGREPLRPEIRRK